MSVTHPAEAAARAGARPRLVDVDVHHGPMSLRELAPYMPKHYRDRLLDFGVGGNANAGYTANGGYRGFRGDLGIKEDERPAVTGTAWNLEMIQRGLLDPCSVDVGILTGFTVYPLASIPDVDYASAGCRAFNDWTLEHFLSGEPRLRYMLAVCPQDPEGAAAEIDRLASNPQVLGIVMPTGSIRPYGFRYYHPIYEACERNGMTVALHFGNDGGGINPPISSAGFPSHYIENRLCRPGFYQVHIASMIFDGVFAKYPRLKVAVLEGGFGWLPPFLWRMDADWKGLRNQTPWVERPPSELVLEHFHFGTQPFDEPEKASELPKLLEWAHAEKLLMFASDFPHWDWDDPAETSKLIPEALRGRILAENAIECFGLEVSSPAR